MADPLREETILDQTITRKPHRPFDQPTFDDTKAIIDAWTRGLPNAFTFRTNCADVKVPPLFDPGT